MFTLTTIPPPAKQIKISDSAIAIGQVQQAMVRSTTNICKLEDWNRFPLNEHLRTKLGRIDALHQVHDLTFQIEEQDSLAGAVYDVMAGLITKALPIGRDSFIRMMKTFMLKRCQDLYYREKGVRLGNALHLRPTVPLPAPIADLLNALGQFDSRMNGFRYDVIPPIIPVQNAPKWATMDHAVLGNYGDMVAQMQTRYVFREFPDLHSYQGAPLGLLRRIPDSEDARIVGIRSLTTEPTPKDAFIRLVNDELFYQPAQLPPIDDYGFMVNGGMPVTELRTSYVFSYVRGTNA